MTSCIVVVRGGKKRGEKGVRSHCDGSACLCVHVLACTDVPIARERVVTQGKRGQGYVHVRIVLGAKIYRITHYGRVHHRSWYPHTGESGISKGGSV